MKLHLLSGKARPRSTIIKIRHLQFFVSTIKIIVNKMHFAAAKSGGKKFYIFFVQIDSGCSVGIEDSKTVRLVLMNFSHHISKSSRADKEKSTEKIDGAIATIMALDRAIRCGNGDAVSVYDDRGLIFI